MVVLGAELVDRSLYRFGQAEHDILDHAFAVGQMGHRLAHPLVTKDRMRVVPADIHIATGITDALEEALVEIFRPALFLELQRTQCMVVEVSVGQLDKRCIGVVDDIENDFIDEARGQ